MEILREVFSLIQSMDIDDVTKQELKDRAVALVAEATERRKAIAVQKIAEMAAMRSRKALDALAAGLDQFANKMSSITNKFGNMTSVLQQEFSQITGERSVGKLNQINPFSKENLANASDVEIDASISQLKGLGGVAEGDKAFKEMAGLIKGQRDFPRVMRDVSAELQGMAATADEAGVTNVQVQEVISKHLEKAGLNFGEVATKAMFDKLDSLATSSRQEGGDLIFSAPKLIAILEEEGDIHKLLGETIERARDKLEEMVDLFK